MSTLAEKLKARKAATQTVVAEGKTGAATASPSLVAVEPVVTEPPKPKARAKSVPGPLGIVPPDAPGGELVHEKHDGVAPKVDEPKSMTPAELREKLKELGALNVDKAICGDEPKADPVVEAEPIVDAAPAKDALDPNVVLAANTIREKWIEEGKKRPLSLFIDCYPEKAEFETLQALEDEIAARTPSLLEHLRKTSPKDVPEGTVDLGEVLFGRGYSTLAASFAVKPLSGPWTVSTLGPASSKVLEVLLPKATFVVRGRR